VTPAVRRLARENGVDLAMVRGTGHGGRVTREDVLNFVASRAGIAPSAAGSPAAPPPVFAAPMTAPAQGASAFPPPVAPPAAPGPSTGAPPAVLGEGDQLKPMTQMRRGIATQMARAVSVPMAYLTLEVDMSGVVALRDAMKREYEAREGIGLSYVAFVTKAAVEALRRHPDINGHWTDQGLLRRAHINVSVAVAVDDGLIAPVIHDADRLSINGLNRAVVDLADRARGNRLRLEDLQGGTFTVDNTGWFGSVVSAPIVNVPEIAILTMEAIQRRPVVVDTPVGEAIAIRPMMYICSSFDHRATDGAQMGRFMQDVKRWLESVDAQTAIW
jgi:2-oxoisovalerate dehydrogenase E2 component (dihydrolipoyl transacylase)